MQRRLEEVVGGLQLHKGYSFCVVMTAQTQRQALLECLFRLRTAAVVSHDGGLISNLTVAENIALPAEYHASDKALLAEALPLYCRCGLIDTQQLLMLLPKLPEQLSLYERRLVGFMRAIRVEPELMVYDGIYDGLAHLEVEQVDRFDECFHLQFPFRTSVLLSFENAYRPASVHQRMIYLDDAFK